METKIRAQEAVHKPIPALEIIHDRFVRMFRITLSGALRKPVDMVVKSAEVVKFGEYLKSLQVPSSLNLYHMNPLKGTAIMMLEPRLIFNLVDMFYGGTGELEVKAGGRDFTIIEQRLIKRVVISALEDLQTAWQPYYKIQISYQRTEINPQFVAIVPQSESVLMVTFHINTGKVPPMTLTLCLPYSMYQPVSIYLKAKGILKSPLVKNVTGILDIGYKATPLSPLIKKVTTSIKQQFKKIEPESAIAPSGENDPENYRELSKGDPGDKTPPLAGLQLLEPKKIATFISNEHPQTITLILAHLIDPKKTADVINALPENLRADVTYRMAILESIPPGVINEIEEMLKNELQKQLNNPSQNVGGIGPTAEVLEAMDKKSSDAILKTIRESNPDLAGSLETAKNQNDVKTTQKSKPQKKAEKS